MDKDILIQKYLKGKLSEKEQEIFTDFLQNDSDFKNKVAFEKDVYKAIKLNKRDALKSEIQNWDNEINTVSYKKWLLVASVLLLGILSYFILPSKTVSSEELYTSNFEPYRNVLYPVVRDQKDLSKTEKAFMYYENGYYDDFLKTIKQTKSTNSDFNFYIANALMATNRVSEAKPILEKYIQNGNKRFLTNAQWYLGLIYLKENNSTKAKILFEKVASKKAFKTNEAKNMLKELD